MLWQSQQIRRESDIAQQALSQERFHPSRDVGWLCWLY